MFIYEEECDNTDLCYQNTADFSNITITDVKSDVL